MSLIFDNTLQTSADDESTAFIKTKLITIETVMSAASGDFLYSWCRLVHLHYGTRAQGGNSASASGHGIARILSPKVAPEVAPDYARFLREELSSVMQNKTHRIATAPVATARIATTRISTICAVALGVFLGLIAFSVHADTFEWGDIAGNAVTFFGCGGK